MFNIEEELKKLPDKPGVYLMHDADDHIIYVGKAVVLKNRVRQYFAAGYKRSAKIEKMVSQIAWFEYIVTDSETEALVLECNLIKQHAPKYNTMLTDDKAYPFIRISASEDFPRIFLARRVKRDGAKYFGPYTSHGAVRDTIKLIQKIYTLRSCNRRLPEDIGKSRPCLNYHIGLCKAPCQGYITKEEYALSVAKAEEFLRGNHAEVKAEINAMMKDASERMEYEEAAGYRDVLVAIKELEECQKITDTGFDNRDIIAIARDEGEAVAQIFFVRDGKLIGRDHYSVRIASGDDDAQIMLDVVKQIYSGSPFMPHEIILENEPAEISSLEKWLSAKAEHKVEIKVPMRGDKLKLLKLAKENANLLLSQNKEQVKRREARTIGAVRELSNLLDLPGLSRMEAYDISNISGFQSVGSMVVFEDGKPRRNDYRKFKIKTVEGPNDYASLYEVITRRFTHGSSLATFPDIILMDGGKGQVNIALEALSELGFDIPVCGMVKDDNHRTRGLYYNGEEVAIDKKSELFHLITNIQDEAHRFAITYHRSLRGKNQVHSILDDIDGIGPKRRKALMREFAGIDEIKSADVDRLASIPEMNRSAARVVYAFFHDGEIVD